MRLRSFDGYPNDSDAHRPSGLTTSARTRGRSVRSIADQQSWLLALLRFGGRFRIQPFCVMDSEVSRCSAR